MQGLQKIFPIIIENSLQDAKIDLIEKNILFTKLFI